MVLGGQGRTEIYISKYRQDKLCLLGLENLPINC